MANAPKNPAPEAQKSEAELRAERRAAALRENLRRRKMQSRGRVAHGSGDTETAGRDDTDS